MLPCLLRLVFKKLVIKKDSYFVNAPWSIRNEGTIENKMKKARSKQAAKLHTCVTPLVQYTTHTTAPNHPHPYSSY
jgi:hypothetical protein